jgi:hypothetical protein
MLTCIERGADTPWHVHTYIQNHTVHVLSVHTTIRLTYGVPLDQSSIGAKCISFRRHLLYTLYIYCASKFPYIICVDFVESILNSSRSTIIDNNYNCSDYSFKCTKCSDHYCIKWFS